MKLFVMKNNNLLLINKPKHWTSNDVVKKVKNILNLKKIGHAGTLDPLATGLLILGLNEGTKQLNSLLLDNKTYLATIHFNYSTTTYDSEGDVVNYRPMTLDLVAIKNALDTFLNCDYYQLPPKYSAIKVNGKKAYELARKNIDFALEPKLVKLCNYEVIDYSNNQLIIKIDVSKGFYVRSFAYDLGIKLNNFATLANLMRTKIGNYKLDDALEIKDLNGLLH